MQEFGVVVVCGNKVKLLESGVHDLDNFEFEFMLLDPDERPSRAAIFSNLHMVASELMFFDFGIHAL